MKNIKEVFAISGWCLVMIILSPLAILVLIACAFQDVEKLDEQTSSKDEPVFRGVRFFTPDKVD